MRSIRKEYILYNITNIAKPHIAIYSAKEYVPCCKHELRLISIRSFRYTVSEDSAPSII